MRAVLAAAAALTVTLAAPAVAAAAPRAAASAHPCRLPEAPQVTLVGRARAGSTARFRVSGTGSPTISWGDGSKVRPRRLRADGTISHRFAKAGRFTVRVSGADGHCCDVQHTECNTTKSTPDRLAVRVLRRRY